MPPNISLSSTQTVLFRFFTPGILLAVLISSGSFAWNHGGASWLLPGFVALVSLIILDSVRKVKFASIQDGSFIVAGYWKSQTIPAAHLYSLAYGEGGRSPSFILRFEPPTIFGPVVVVMPPYNFFRSNDRNTTGDLLLQIVLTNQAARQGGIPNPST
jgi:hypothetical protein